MDTLAGVSHVFGVVAHRHCFHIRLRFRKNSLLAANVIIVDILEILIGAIPDGCAVARGYGASGCLLSFSTRGRAKNWCRCAVIST